MGTDKYLTFIESLRLSEIIKVLILINGELVRKVHENQDGG